MSVNNSRYGTRPFENSLGDRIRVLREERRESQADLATALSLGQRATIEQWEKGTRLIKAAQLAEIAKHFNVSADYLLGLSDIKTRDASIRDTCEYTGLSEQAIQNLHNESHDKEAIAALVYMLSSDYNAFHRINLLIHKSISLRQSYCNHIRVPLGQLVSDDIKSAFWECLDKWGGTLLEPQDAADYYASEAAHIFQNMIEKAAVEEAE